MNLYHRVIQLRPESRPLAFASAVDTWITYLWQIATLLIDGRSCLDAAIAASDDGAEQLYARMHQVTAHVDVGLHRLYPDAAQRETIALI